ncbi:MAG: CpsB/CapC family capsule biosynthesis tyrosine phosphatase [Bacteroidota bacterium]
MFSFFEKKIFLVDHLHGLVDIHNHILPGIDDGATSADESIQLIKGFKEFGIKNFVFTPHIMHHYYPNTPKTIKDAYETLKKELFINPIEDIQIDYAAEYMIDDNFDNLVDKNSVLTLRKEFLLVEMSYLQPPINFDEAIEKVKTKGMFPVLAHPERYGYLHKKEKKYFELKQNNIHFQLNLLSLSDYYGKEIKSKAFKLLENNFYNYVGSDVHNLRHLDKLKEIKIEKKRLDKVLDLVNNTIIDFN